MNVQCIQLKDSFDYIIYIFNLFLNTLYKYIYFAYTLFSCTIFFYHIYYIRSFPLYPLREYTFSFHTIFFYILFFFVFPSILSPPITSTLTYHHPQFNTCIVCEIHHHHPPYPSVTMATINTQLNEMKFRRRVRLYKDCFAQLMAQLMRRQRVARVGGGSATMAVSGSRWQEEMWHMWPRRKSASSSSNADT